MSESPGTDTPLLEMPEAAGDRAPAPPPAAISSGVFQFLFITGCIVLFVLISKLYLDQYIEIRKLEQKLEQEKARVVEAGQEIDRLTQELEFLKTDEGVEKVAREKLKMVKPDEVIIVPVN
ncbi:MAG: septum formation initiator family protein [Candidatus Riflebacteria bacterium]|nr:septum formation initiator family protein [Candidatus Riflebacteria bacterium]